MPLAERCGHEHGHIAPLHLNLLVPKHGLRILVGRLDDARGVDGDDGAILAATQQQASGSLLRLQQG